MKICRNLFLIILLLLSCSYSSGLREIRGKDVFLQKEERYIVLFYSPSCPSCNQTIELLNKRYIIRKYVGFLVNINNEEINFTKEKYSNIGKENFEDMIFSTTPYLVYISSGKIEKEVYGYTNIHKENLYIFFE